MKAPTDDPGAIRRDWLKERSIRAREDMESPVYYEYEEDSFEDEIWYRMVEEQFFAGYSEDDAGYDEL